MKAFFLAELEACKNELIAFCRSLLWKKEDLEDALQEVFLQAIRAFPRFQPGTRFKAWLFRVATHTLYNFNRKGQPRPLQKDPTALAAVSDPEIELRLEDTYASILTDSDRLVGSLDRGLRRAVALLNDTERTVFLLRALGDLKYREIADILGLPLGSVMGTLGRARAKLRRALAEYSYEM